MPFFPRTPTSRVAILLFLCLAAAPLTFAEVPWRPEMAAPTAPSIAQGARLTSEPRPDVAAQQYSIGDPTAQEQQYLEYINRARANPAAEADRIATTTDPDVVRALGNFAVNLALMRAQFALIAPQPPLSMNRLLLTMARAHTQNMFDLGYQGHGDSDGAPSSLQSRMTNSGYLAGASSWSYGENAFSFSYSTFYGHAGFEVDWGIGTGGMQIPPGHRDNIHSSSFREIGVGIVAGSKQVGGRQPVGPQLVTQEFARADSDAFITGVVYQDRNGNGFYDVGEGIPNVRVDVPGISYFAVTAGSGGYSIPVVSDGSYNVTFSGGGVPTAQRSAVVTNGQNVKVDLLTTVASVNPVRFGNISTRVQVGRGSNVLIGGFIIRGTGDKKVVVRAIGPRLGDFGVPNPLLNPSLQVFHGSDPVPVASNDDWGTTAGVAEIIAGGFAPRYPQESALLLQLPAGDYTAVVSGVGDSAGAGLVEVYEMDGGGTAQLQNISTRAIVGTDNDVMIGGMIVSGAGTQKVVVRAIGPTLTQYGVAGALANPAVQLKNEQGVTIASNSDWQTGPGAGEISRLNFAPANPLEAALIVDLGAGNYTAIVSGEGPNPTGVALVEAYRVD